MKINKYLHNFTLLIIGLVLLSPLSSFSQRKCKFGFGINVGSADFINQKKDICFNSNVGLSINADYKVAPRWNLKIATEFKTQGFQVFMPSQNIVVANYIPLKMFKISIPLLAQYTLYQNNNNAWSFGLDGGLVWDVNSSVDESGSRSDVSLTYKIKSTDTENSILKPNVNGRLGCSILKEYSSNLGIHIYFHYITQLVYYDYLFYETKVFSSFEPDYQISTKRSIVPILPNLWQTGLYITF